MAGSIVQTLEPIFDEGKKRDKFKLTMAWTSDGSGDVSGISTDDGTFITRKITDILKGKEIVGGEVTPDATDVPTTLFDVVVNDSNSVDLFGGAFADLSETATTTSYPFDATVYGSKIIKSALTPVVSNAGDAKKGLIVLMFE